MHVLLFVLHAVQLHDIMLQLLLYPAAVSVSRNSAFTVFVAPYYKLPRSCL